MKHKWHSARQQLISMSCNITSSITKGCNTNIGGVKTIWLGNGPVVTTWYKFEMDRGTASLVETYNITQTASIVGYTQALTIQLNKMTAAQQEQINEIAEANNMRVRVEVNSGMTFELGNERGAYLASGTTTTGQSFADANQSQLVIQADSKDPMESYELVGTVEGTVSNYMAGCYNYPPLSPGGQRTPFRLQNASGLVLVEAFPGAGYFTKFETDAGYVYTCTAQITATYNSNAFDTQGDSVAVYSSGYGAFRLSDTGTKQGEPTQPGVQTTYTVVNEFITYTGADSNPLVAWTILDCATSTIQERRFSGPATANITITRRLR